ncbi:MAG TPA: serine hydrolase domain-containing protein, partial [Candidatus Binataceae bacterium]|nr:serine hydrolase domain-containing protein [Candidatus Binataceae bacterium]
MRAEGTVEKGFEAVRDAFAQGQADDPGGAQLCVFRHGRRVVDLWAGTDKINGRPFTGETISILMSCTKAVTAVCVHMLAQQGLIDYDAPVARYWPEFAAGGKSAITVRDILTHRAGLMHFNEEAGISGRELLDWNRCTAALASMAPWWKPGSAYFYHAVTFGFLAGELVRRVSGKTVGRFVSENIAGPLEIDLWIGLPAEQEHRVAPHILPASQPTEEQARALFSALGLDLNSRPVRAMLNMMTAGMEGLAIINTREAHAAELPFGNGIANARALAKMYAACIGAVGGVRLLASETIERARESQNEGIGAPPELMVLAGPGPQRFGLGFELPRAIEPMLGDGSFGHAGAGGRMAF